MTTSISPGTLHTRDYHGLRLVDRMGGGKEDFEGSTAAKERSSFGGDRKGRYTGHRAWGDDDQHDKDESETRKSRRKAGREISAKQEKVKNGNSKSRDGKGLRRGALNRTSWVEEKGLPFSLHTVAIRLGLERFLQSPRWLCSDRSEALPGYSLLLFWALRILKLLHWAF